MNEEEFARRAQESIDELTYWITHRARNVALLTVPKAIEYGSTPLVEFGRSLYTTFGNQAPDTVTDKQAFEAAILFYIKGKIARWEAAVKAGQAVSDDTVFDIGVYALMVEREREVGGWPFKESFEYGTTLEVDMIAQEPTPPGGGVRATFEGETK